MTTHFSIDDQIAALEGPLDAARASHLESCAACRREVDELRGVMALVAAADLPEPSPLFWDHFSARVRGATAGESTAAGAGFWRGWRSWAVVATAALALVTTMAVRHGFGPSTGVSDSSGAASRDELAFGSETAPLPWTDVMQMASGLSSDEVPVLLPGSAESLTVEDLSPAERAAFVRLLNEAMETQQ